MIPVKVNCPLCDSGQLTIIYDPGDPGVRYYSDGSGEPPTPPGIEDITATCGCWSKELCDKVFNGVEFETWFCTNIVRKTRPAFTYLKGRGEDVYYRDQCRTYNRVGDICSACGAIEPPDAFHNRNTDPHPLYSLLETLVNAWYGIADYIASEAEADAYPQDEESEAQEDAQATITYPDERQ